ncbi:hypothetical protein [Lactobacillus acetotolerans]|uniref:hypothetical protein n=1 Tax=Lactobacillus acetotolerans TaxID=1600 RepID=UPI002FDA9D7B
MTGKRYGKLVAIKVDNSKRKIGDTKNYWLFKCDCGNYKIISGAGVRNGHSRSCGCGIVESDKKRFTKHGNSKTKLYKVWVAMRKRCRSVNDKDYANYGKRGIRVCDDWKEFKNFKDWSIKNGYRGGLSIDRIDVDSGYNPNNCRWVDDTIQANNRTNNHKITVDEETLTLSEWSKKTGIKYSTLSSRINTYGWDIKRALEII